MGNIKKFRIKSFKDEQTQIELKDISVSYNKREIFSNLSFKISKGEIMGMIGPNGVGKSTIFYLISGFIKPNYGKVLLIVNTGRKSPYVE